VNASASDRRIRSLRPSKAHVDPYAAHGVALDDERRPDGTIERALTVFLAGAECSYTCAFCDLWKWTVEGATPPGALTRQLERVLDDLEGPLPDRLKLYTASNFFDRRAVPPEDLEGIARLAAPFAAITVESHANTIGESTLDFARRIPGRLEIAVGLETISPMAIAQLNKRLDLVRFDRAARFLADNGLDLRVFVLLGAPYVPARESVEWTVRSVAHAVERDARFVAIIPVRGGNGEMERLRELGQFTPPTLAELEGSLDRSLRYASAVVTADLWDVELLPACEHCRPQRIDRLRRLNVSGRAEPRIACARCEAA
jgi:radical SAM enzyme (TIGR01210 family)